AKAVAFTEDGNRFAVLFARPAVADVHVVREPGNWLSWRRLNSFQWSESWGHSLCFSPNGEAMAVGLELDAALWNIVDNRPPLTWTAHDAAVLSVAFTHDGDTLLTGGADGL